VPACVSYGRLRRATLPAPRGPVFLDSRGFSEISEHGCYTFSAREYAAFVRRLRDEWGERLAHASIMDWMCEPQMLSRTGKTIAEHQQLTVNSWVTLNSIDASLPWVPVLQGYSPDDYERCADLYQRHTCTHLASLPLVGIGSVCRRQGMAQAADIITRLYARGLTNLHGFGFKLTGLVSRKLRLCRYLASADSMAWSRRARNAWLHERRRLCGCAHRGGCANCLAFALQWRERLLTRVTAARRGGTQQLLF
jgi:hypothetical protein